LTEAIKLDEAYAACRSIAKREAKNFYYAFVALPEHRRNAICAIYAFMRRADDLADDENLSHEERRRSGIVSLQAEKRAIRFFLRLRMQRDSSQFRTRCWMS